MITDEKCLELRGDIAFAMTLRESFGCFLLVVFEDWS